MRFLFLVRTWSRDHIETMNTIYNWLPQLMNTRHLFSSLRCKCVNLYQFKYFAIWAPCLEGANNKNKREGKRNISIRNISQHIYCRILQQMLVKVICKSQRNSCIDRWPSAYTCRIQVKLVHSRTAQVYFQGALQEKNVNFTIFVQSWRF